VRPFLAAFGPSKAAKSNGDRRSPLKKGLLKIIKVNLNFHF
jgi:hypothetical protein